MSRGPAGSQGRGPSSLERVVPLLRCPACGLGMRLTEGAVLCGDGHSFDRARQGYLSLFGPRGRRFPGDGADQVTARDRVLGSGLFDPLAAALGDVAREALTHAADDSPAGAAPSADAARTVVLEPGAGTGFYLAGVVDAVARTGPGAEVLGVGTEISTAAARRLVRVHEDVAALVADTWEGLPLADGSVDLVQVVFAPRNPAEFARVLRPGGTAVVAVPGPGHLEPLRSAGGMLEPAPGKGDRLDADLSGDFTAAGMRTVDVHTEVPAPVAVDLALMGPSGVHLDRARLEERLGTGDHPIRLHVEVRSYRLSPPGGRLQQ